MLGFQRDLTHMCGLEICPDHFCCLLVLKMGVAKWPPNARSLWTIKVVKFVVGKRKSVDLWRKARPTKMSLGAKPVLKTGVAKWPPRAESSSRVLSGETCSDFNEIWHACVAWRYAQTNFFVWLYSKWAWQNGRQTSGPYGLQK